MSIRDPKKMKINHAMIQHKHVYLPWLLQNTEVTRSLLSLLQYFFYKENNGERNLFGPETMNITAKLTNFQELPFKEEYLYPHCSMAHR
jgi:hypothetical protein